MLYIAWACLRNVFLDDALIELGISFILSEMLSVELGRIAYYKCMVQKEFYEQAEDFP